MTKFFISLCFLFFHVNAILAQNTKEQINAIKLDESYVYGESKNKIHDTAMSYAVQDLLNNVNALRSETGLSSLGETDINNKYKELLYQRGDLVYIFIYLKKDEVLNNFSCSIQPLVSVIDEDEVDVDPNLIAFENTINGQFVDEILQNIIERQMIDNVYGYLQQAKANNKIEDFAKAKQMTEIPDCAFLVIYNRTYEVVAVLTNKIEGKRINVKTNKPDSITNYSGHGIIWYINKSI